MVDAGVMQRASEDHVLFHEIRKNIRTVRLQSNIKYLGGD